MQNTEINNRNTGEICRLCAMEHQHVVQLFTDDSQEVDRLAQSIYAYLGIELINDGVLPNWMCAACQLDAETTEKFLLLVQEAQKKLQELQLNPVVSNESQIELLKDKQKADCVGEHVTEKEVPVRKHTNVTARGRKKRKKRGARTRILSSVRQCGDSESHISDEDLLSASLISNTNDVGDNGLNSNEPIAELRTASGASLAEIIKVNAAAHKSYSRIRLICEYCKEIFTNNRELQNHLQTHKNCAFECTECLNNFRIKSEFEQHQRQTQHQGMGIIENMLDVVEGEEKCKNIDEKSDKPTSINIVIDNNGAIKSINSHSNQPSMENDQVVEKTAAEAKANTHLKKRTSKKTETATKFSCLKCNKAFDNQYAVLRHHKQVHIGLRNFKCDQCGASFKNRTNYSYHLAKHTGQREFNCEICSKAFVVKHELTLHMRTHTGDKPYKCEQCGREFSFRSNLVVHMRLHTGQRPFQCETCGASFNSSSHCKAHKAKHLKRAEKQLNQQISIRASAKKAEVHKEYLSNAVNLKANINARIPNSSQLEHAYAESGTTTCRSLLKRNVQKETIQSDKPKVIHIETLAAPVSTLKPNEQRLAKEVTMGEVYRHSCPYCQKLFKAKSALTKHLRTHTGEKPFRCPICPRTFADVSNLRRHKKGHKNATEQLQTVTSKLSNADLVQRLRKNTCNRMPQACTTIALPSPTHSSAASDPDPDGLEVIERIERFDDESNEKHYFPRQTKALQTIDTDGFICISYQDPENPHDGTTTTFFIPN